jgi:hypothetical protein
VVDNLLYRLSRAASIAAMSIFRIVMIAFIARLAAARSGRKSGDMIRISRSGRHGNGAFAPIGMLSTYMRTLLMTRLLLYGYCIGITSLRKIGKFRGQIAQPPSKM